MTRSITRNGLRQLVLDPPEVQQTVLAAIFRELPEIERVFADYFERRRQPSDAATAAHYLEAADETTDPTERAEYLALAARVDRHE